GRRTPAMASRLALLAAAGGAGTELAEQAEAVDARAVAVLPGERDRVVADAVQVHELLAREVEVLRDRVVALAARARAPAAQVVEREDRLVAVLPGDGHPAGGALVADLERLGRGRGHRDRLAPGATRCPA